MLCYVVLFVVVLCYVTLCHLLPCCLMFAIVEPWVASKVFTHTQTLLQLYEESSSIRETICQGSR